MWFRQRSQQTENDRLRASSQRGRQRKPSSKIPRGTGDNKETVPQTNPISPSRSRNDCSLSRRRLSLLSDEDENGKDKVLKTEQKYKKNRITKSTSRSKIPDLKIEKVPSGTINPQALDATTKSPAKKRRNTNLNLNALLRYKSFISDSTKKLTSEDFDRLRRKSLGETNKVARRKSSCDNILNKTTDESKDENNKSNLNLQHLSVDDDDDDTTEYSQSPTGTTETVNHSRKSSPMISFPKWSDSIHSSKKSKNHKKDRPSQASVQRQPSDRRTDVLNTTTQGNHPNAHELSASHSIDNDSNVQDDGIDNRDSAKSKSAPVSVNRSESYKERVSHTRNNRKNRRKTSDPSLTSKSNDDHQVELGIHNTNFAASSSSSLSSSLGSPSTSLEAVGTPHGQQTPTPQQAYSNFIQLHAPRQWVDSEEEAGELEADWSSHVSAEILHTLSDTEKRRQEIINEIYQTERNHVRTLRLLEGIFMRPLQETGALTHEHFTLLFPPSLLILKDLHSSFEQQLKQRRNDHGQLVGGIGDLLLSMFDGSAGDQLLEHAAHFCARQKIALEALKESRRKDETLQRLLTKAESHKACRRLQLKDLLPTVLQRLTKYPLLFDSLAKITLKSPDALVASQADKAPVDTEKEIQAIQRARELSRRILDHVNQAVREAEDTHTLQTIQKRLDKSMYEKEPNNELKHLDLTQHKLIYEGPLIHKKQPREQLHGLLFETMVVLLHKQDDKYILKYLVSPGSAAGESKNEIRFNPITKINLILVRQSAVEKNSFYLINTNVTQMLELTAPSALECKTWFNHISAAAEAYKQRTKSNHDMTPVEDPSSVTIPTSTIKESPESEFVTSSSSISASSTNPIVDSAHSQPNAPDADANDRDTDHGAVNGSATGKSSEDDAIDSKSNKYIPGQYSNNSNNTRTLTQQSSLVAPSEVHVSISPALTAQPVLTPNEQLRRLDESIRHTLVEKQKIVCDIFKVPNEHFSAIADIAGQPEAPKEPSDILLAAFAQVQSLTGLLNEHIKIPQIAPNEMLVKSASLRDDCFKNAEKYLHDHRQQMKAKQQTHSTSTSNISQSPSTPTVINNSSSDSIALTEVANNLVPDDDGYCEIDAIRLPAIIKSPPIPTSTVQNDPRRQSAPAPLPPNDDTDVSEQTEPSTHDDKRNASSEATTPSDDSNNISTNKSNDEYIEVNSAYDSISQPLAELNLNNENNKTRCDNTICGSEMNTDARDYSIPTIPCHLISAYVAALNLHISHLLPKLNERDMEREKLRKENQLLRDRLNSLHEREQFTQLEN